MRTILYIYLSLLNQCKQNKEFTVDLLNSLAKLMFFNLDKNYQNQLLMREIKKSNHLHRDLYSIKDVLFDPQGVDEDFMQ